MRHALESHIYVKCANINVVMPDKNAIAQSNKGLQVSAAQVREALRVEGFKELKRVDNADLVQALKMVLRRYRRNVNRLRSENIELRKRVLYDNLTKAGSRAKYEDESLRAVASFIRNPKIGITFIIIDLNKFKAINDFRGHKAGDSALRTLSTVLEDQSRNDEAIYRVGGDEFVVIQNGTNGAVPYLKRVRNKLEELHKKDGNSVRITISAGHCSTDEITASDFPVEKTRDGAKKQESAIRDFLFNRADERMYEEKGVPRKDRSS